MPTTTAMPVSREVEGLFNTSTPINGTDGEVSVTIPIDDPRAGAVITKVTLKMTTSMQVSETIVIKLTRPGGSPVTLIDALPGNSNNFCSSLGAEITLDEDGATPLMASDCDLLSQLTGTFNTNGNLNQFNGQNPHGDWTLSITNPIASSNSRLVSATLTVTSTA